MYVSVIHLFLPSHPTGQAMQLWRESVLPELQEQLGWKDASFAVSESADEIRVFTVWENKTQARAYEPCRGYHELAKLAAPCSQIGKRAIYRLGDEPEILESFTLFGSLN